MRTEWCTRVAVAPAFPISWSHGQNALKPRSASQPFAPVWGLFCILEPDPEHDDQCQHPHACMVDQPTCDIKMLCRCLVRDKDLDAPSFLLESVVNGDQQGRYSFVGAMPAMEVGALACCGAMHAVGAISAWCCGVAGIMGQGSHAAGTAEMQGMRHKQEIRCSVWQLFCTCSSFSYLFSCNCL